MSEAILKQMLLKLFPKGSIWRPKIEEDFDKLLDGMAANADYEREFLATLARIRDPQTTEYLDDLEFEYGLIKDDRLTEQERRDQLQAIVYAIAGSGAQSYLQDILHTAGFTNLFVYQNNTPTDPNLFFGGQALMVAGGGNAYAGFYPTSLPTTAVAGLTGGIGELIVNGDLFQQYVDTEMVAGGSVAYAGFHTSGPPPYKSVAGYFEDTERQLVEYFVPGVKDFWPFVFYISHEDFQLIEDSNMEDPTTDAWASTQAILTKETTGLGSRKGRVLRMSWNGSSVTANAVQVAGEVGQIYRLTGEARVSNVAQNAAYQITGGAPVNIHNNTDWESFDITIGPITGSPNDIKIVATGMSAGRWAEWNNVQMHSLVPVDIPAQRREIFKTLVLKYKPLHSWCAALVNYT